MERKNDLKEEIMLEKNGDMTTKDFKKIKLPKGEFIKLIIIGDLIINEDCHINGNLHVKGKILQKKRDAKLYVKGDVFCNGDIEKNSCIEVGGDFECQGNLYGPFINVKGELKFALQKINLNVPAYVTI